jgi:hypothetical protein
MLARHAAAAVFFVSSVAAADSHGTFYVGIATGEYIPVKQFQASSTFGGGGNIIFGYQRNAHWSLQLDWTMWLLSGGGYTTWDLKAIPEMKVDIGSWSVKPFVLGGIGIDYQLDNPGNASSARTVLVAGAGLRWNLHAHSALFIEGLVYAPLRAVTTYDVPVVAGMTIDL